MSRASHARCFLFPFNYFTIIKLRVCRQWPFPKTKHNLSQRILRLWVTPSFCSQSFSKTILSVWAWKHQPWTKPEWTWVVSTASYMLSLNLWVSVWWAPGEQGSRPFLAGSPTWYTQILTRPRADPALCHISTSQKVKSQVWGCQIVQLWAPCLA